VGVVWRDNEGEEGSVRGRKIRGERKDVREQRKEAGG